jgi:hypothetical protein
MGGYEQGENRTITGKLHQNGRRISRKEACQSSVLLDNFHS